MIYYLFGSIFCFVMSAVFFAVHKEFRKGCRLDPPDCIYHKNNIDLDMKAEVRWETPKIDLEKEDIEILNVFLFIFKWGLIAAGWFLLAAVISMNLKI